MSTVTLKAPTVPSATYQFARPFAFHSSTRTLVHGPAWESFEDFRTAGKAGLESIPNGGVATLNCKAGKFRILREEDFQYLVGLAAEVQRLAKGVKVVAQAAKVVIKHPDEEHVKLLLECASLIAESPELPQRDGHTPFELSEEDRKSAEEDFDLVASEIPRPQW
jgi:hypothetical protein